jgi:hypothetical protein
MKILSTIFKLLALSILLTIAFFSCEKDNKICWHCTFGVGPNGYVKPPLDTCIDGNINLDEVIFVDLSGNIISSDCSKK